MSISENIFNIIARQIQNARPGSKLESETVLCRRFGAARMTVSRALNQLKEQGLIVRRQGAGTFVAFPQKVVLLLPCENFLSRDDVDAANFRQLFEGAMRKCHDLGIILETLVATSDNDDNHIDINILKNINMTHQVIISIWFHNIFEKLNQTGAKICLYHNQAYFPGYRQFSTKWLKLEYLRREAITQVMEYFYQKGKRKIALIAPFLRTEHHPVNEGYTEFVLRHNMPRLVMHIKYTEDNLPRTELQRFYRHNQPDALIISSLHGKYANTSVNDALGLPDALEIFGFNQSLNVFPFARPFSYCIQNYNKTGSEAVRLLNEPGSNRKTFKYEYEFHYVNERKN